MTSQHWWCFVLPTLCLILQPYGSHRSISEQVNPTAQLPSTHSRRADVLVLPRVRFSSEGKLFKCVLCSFSLMTHFAMIAPLCDHPQLAAACTCTRRRPTRCAWMWTRSFALHHPPNRRLHKKDNPTNVVSGKVQIHGTSHPA